MSYQTFRSKERSDGSKYSYPIENGNQEYSGRTLHVQEVPQREVPKSYKVIFLFENFDDPHAMDMMEEFEIQARSSLEAMMIALSRKKNPNDPAHVVMLDPDIKQVLSAAAGKVRSFGSKIKSSVKSAGSSIKKRIVDEQVRIKGHPTGEAMRNLFGEESLAEGPLRRMEISPITSSQKEETPPSSGSHFSLSSAGVGQPSSSYEEPSDYIEFEDLPLAPEAEMIRLARSNPPPWDVTIYPLNMEELEDTGQLRLIPDYEGVIGQLNNPDYNIRNESKMLLATYYPDEYSDWMSGIELI